MKHDDPFNFESSQHPSFSRMITVNAFAWVLADPKQNRDVPKISSTLSVLKIQRLLKIDLFFR